MIVALVLLGLAIVAGAGLGLGLLLYALVKRKRREGPGRWLAGGLGCLTGVLLAGCLLAGSGAAYMAGWGLIDRDRALAGGTTEPLEPRVTYAPPGQGATPPPAEPAPEGPLAAGLLPAERVDLAKLEGRPRYTIDVAVDWEQATVSGREEVVFTNRQSVALDQVVLRLYPNAPYFEEGGLRVGNVAAGGRPAGSDLQQDDTALIVHLPAPLPPAAQVAVTLDFTVTVPHRPDRFGTYEDVMALGQWYPLLSVYDDEGWNTDPYIPAGDPFYSESGLFTLTLTVPQDVTVAASGVETARSALGDGRQRVTYHGAAMRDLALALSPKFETARAIVDGTVVTSYYLPGDEQGGQRALEAAAQSVQVYNDAFGRYPYVDLDVVETYFLIDGSPGGMEYPGLVLISSEFYDPQSGYVQTDLDRLVVAHEVAHQWWYGVVGNDQVDDPWLDEALATYSSILFFEATQGREAADRQLWAQATLPYRTAQLQGQDRPVATPLPAFGDDLMSYSAIVYGKGALFMEKLRELLGHDRFLAMLQGYYAEHKHGLVQPEDFRRALLTAAGQAGRQDAVEKLYRDWVLVPGGE